MLTREADNELIDRRARNSPQGEHIRGNTVKLLQAVEKLESLTKLLLEYGFYDARILIAAAAGGKPDDDAHGLAAIEAGDRLVIEPRLGRLGRPP